MGQEEIELVTRLRALFPATGDLKPALDDEEIFAGLREILDPSAEFRFVDPPMGGALGDFRVPGHGVEGFQAGWREWLEPWEEFRIIPEEELDAGQGQVLMLVELRGRVRDGAEVRQPGAAIVRIRDGWIVAMDYYMDRDQARRDAGLS